MEVCIFTLLVCFFLVLGIKLVRIALGNAFIVVVMFYCHLPLIDLL